MSLAHAAFDSLIENVSANLTPNIAIGLNGSYFVDFHDRHAANLKGQPIFEFFDECGANRILRSMKTGDCATWCAAVGELVIAWVIYRELKANREAIFLAEAFGPQYYEDRKKIYLAYLEESCQGSATPSRKELWLRSKTFTEKLAQDNNLTALCQSQCTHLNKIAYLYGKRVVFNRYRWFRRVRYTLFHDRLVEWFPNAVVSCWIILGPYILRRASLIGHYWSAPFIGYTLACVDFIDRDATAQLSFYRNNPKENLIISKAVLSEIRDELEMLHRARSRLDVNNILEELNHRHN